MHSIHWPAAFLPGLADNFVSNEVIVAGLSVEHVWPLLAQPRHWPSYYANSANVQLEAHSGPELAEGVSFFFETFGFPVQARCNEYVAPTASTPGRVAWHGWAGAGETRLDVHHAWLIEALPGGRLRILTQETQNGQPALALARQRPNPMLNGHQDWLDGLVAAARSAAGLEPA